MSNNRYLKGTNGRVFLEGEPLGNLMSIASKITYDLAETKLCGSDDTDYTATGKSGEGSLKFQKTNSMGMNLFKTAMASGDLPVLTIVTELVDQQTLRAERVTLRVIFYEFSPVQFDSKGLIEEELPFKIVTYRPEETI
ncbi:phage tail tube protein [Clostridium estertheticum]|uniref:phage tail tube protein n=1 Tax=Clostridium estertheticum TaxID=238834 RepID=UPI001C6E4C85|nr:phage tail tube protein [Clostridium estertheticum]MBW9170779.1 phage tail tube protein [Clostridium estertheticum]WLC74382.1 phage tail tube protein [Clostridium estertheticum]